VRERAFRSILVLILGSQKRPEVQIQAFNTTMAYENNDDALFIAS